MREAALESTFKAIFGGSLVQNNFRALLAEQIVLLGLGEGWKHVGGWGNWDLEHSTGFRVEVKQSAARQSWVLPPGSKPSEPRFDIAVRKEFWSEATGSTPAEGRAAHCYVFAWHPVADETCDHREPTQWRFFVVPTSALPNAKSMSLKSVRALANDVGVNDLGIEIQRLLFSEWQAATS